MKPSTLVITTTHGDEAFAIPVIERLKQRYGFAWEVGNPEALARKLRFWQQDLNRSGPGNSRSPIYEVRRAKELIGKAKDFEVTIDIHGTVSNTGVFLILSDPNWKNIELAKRLDVKRVVLWPSLQPSGPLTQFIDNSLEIECGPKDEPETAIELDRVLKRFLSQKPRLVEPEFYLVTGFLNGSADIPMQDFELTSYQGTQFYPLMIDQYPGIKCYMLQKLNQTLEY